MSLAASQTPILIRCMQWTSQNSNQKQNGKIAKLHFVLNFESVIIVIKRRFIWLASKVIIVGIIFFHLTW